MASPKLTEIQTVTNISDDYENLKIENPKMEWETTTEECSDEETATQSFKSEFGRKNDCWRLVLLFLLVLAIAAGIGAAISAGQRNSASNQAHAEESGTGASLEGSFSESNHDSGRHHGGREKFNLNDKGNRTKCKNQTQVVNETRSFDNLFD